MEYIKDYIKILHHFYIITDNKYRHFHQLMDHLMESHYDSSYPSPCQNPAGIGLRPPTFGAQYSYGGKKRSKSKKSKYLNKKSTKKRYKYSKNKYAKKINLKN